VPRFVKFVPAKQWLIWLAICSFVSMYFLVI